ncbi:MAG TPA: glycosyl hydrolase family 28-related protein [Verrucomicrobiae bacterium]|nr:glycosyl hydrolase family 28-related protein [Verrucomicrobiae bacterium]
MSFYRCFYSQILFANLKLNLRLNQIISINSETKIFIGKKSKQIQTLLLSFALAATAQVVHADQTKSNNNANLELGSSWVSGTAPSSGDNAIWDSTVVISANCTNTLGSAAIWNGIIINNPSAPVLINGNTTLTLNNGVNLNNATVNLGINCGTINLGGNQIWSIPTGLTLVTGSSTTSGAVNSPNNGNFIVTKTGGGVWTTSGTGDNGSSGIIISGGTVNLDKTSSSGTHAVGGPGLTINNGGMAKITGTGGDQIYDGASVSVASGGVFDLNGKTETFAGLNGNGVVDNSAPTTSASLTLNNGSSTFSGSIQNSGASLAFTKSGTGTVMLNGKNSYTGGTTVSGGTLLLSTTANVSMPYTLNGGTLNLIAANSINSLPMSSLTLNNGAQLTFNPNGQRNLAAPLINDSGNLSINSTITVNVQNVVQSGTYVLLQYGSRSGSGSFISGSLPSGATLTDDTAHQRLVLNYTSLLEPRVIIPTLNTNEVVVAIATPQQYGAVGDGVTDDSAAFQAAINAVYNSGGSGGGVVFVPTGNYAFYNNISVPLGVTLHGDWMDWTKTGNGLAGTTFKVYVGAGQTNATPFITLNNSTALRDVNIWYPNQNPNSIVGYPFTIGLGSDCVVQNVVLVNSYQGIETFNGNGDKHILSTVIGTPLYKGIDLDQIFDVCHAEDIRFSPDIWPASGLSNAPAIGGAYATWMRNNGEAMRLRRVDGDMMMDIHISGYNVGLEANAASNGQPGITVYSGSISNCAVALLAQDMPGAFGLMFANLTLDGDIAINRTNATDDANAMFDHCIIIGRSGIAVSSIGADWHSWMQFQDCTISNAMQLTGPGVFNVVNSTLLGSTQCVMAATATRAAFTGCNFNPAMNIINHGNASNLLVDARQAISSPLPIVDWTNVANDFLSRHAASTNLYVTTDVPWGAYGDGTHDDTTAIQSALTAAGNNGGGIVYLPAGKYKLTSTLDVPNGVELRGAFEMRHRTQAGTDGHAKGTVLQPYGGQGTTNGPPAIALEANSGLIGVTISYETQNTNCIPFPPTIQGRGANVYVIGVCCPNPYYYLDLDTYTCTNHFIDMLDGWALKIGYHIGNGSSGAIVDCHCNWTYWIDNGDSQSTLPQNIQAPVLSFTSHNLEMYILGDCTETMVKDFSIIEKTYFHAVDENGRGPNVTLINNYCDASIQGFVLDAAAPASVINAVNTPITAFNFGGYGDQSQSTVVVMSTTNYQGMAHFNSSVLWGGNYLDFNINGGDVAMEMVHSDNASAIGSLVNGGVFHLINYSDSINNSSPCTVTFGADSGIAGWTNEFIGCFAYNGCSYINAATNNNPANVWNDYALSAYSMLNPNLPVIYNFSPNNLGIFQYTNTLNFSIVAPAGISTNQIVVTLDGVILTNLIFTGSPTSWNITYIGVSLNAAHTVSVTATDGNGQVVSTTANFDTFSSSNYTWEAEDFNYGGGLFIDNPQTNAYAGRSATDGIDYHSVNSGQGAQDYRPNTAGLETEIASDVRRAAYNGLSDYDIGFNSTGNWGNYTRTFPAGIYNIYMRGADGIAGVSDSASLSLVTSGQNTTNQTIVRLGTFSVPSTGDWQKYTWVPLMNTHGNFVQVTNNGAIQTFRVTTDNGNYNANFYQLVPVLADANAVVLDVEINGQNLILSFPTQTGFGYQVEYKNDLSDTNWIPLGNPVVGNDSVQSISDAIGASNCFYRIEVFQ